MAIRCIVDRLLYLEQLAMPDGFAYTSSGLPYIPDISLPPQLQPSLPQLTPSGLPYISDVLLPQQLQPITPSGLTYIPDVSLPEQLQPLVVPEPEVGYGPLELLSDVAKGAWDIVSGAAKTVADTAGFILENLELGVGVATGTAAGIGAIISQQKQAEAQKTEAEAQKIAAEAYKLKTLAAQMVGPVTVPTAKQPLTYITPETGKAPNYMLYVALASLALIFLRKK